MRAIILAVCALAACTSTPRQADRAFVIAEPSLIPEGIAYDPVARDFFVSSTWQRRIVRITPDGRAHEFTPRNSDALFGVLGMRVDAPRRRLWAAHASAGAGMPIENDASSGRSGLALFDLSSGRLARNLVPDDGRPHFLNDLDIAADGAVYVSDSMTSTIWRVPPDGETLQPFAQLPRGRTGNGVALSEDERTLFVADAGEGVHAIDMNTRQARTLGGLASGVGGDGLYLHEGALIVIEPWAEDCRVCRYELDSEAAALVTRAPVLAAHPDFLQPTTGVIVGGDLYLLANSQLQRFRALYEAHGAEAPERDLSDVVVLRIPLS